MVARQGGELGVVGEMEGLAQEDSDPQKEKLDELFQDQELQFRARPEYPGRLPRGHPPGAPDLVQGQVGYGFVGDDPTFLLDEAEEVVVAMAVRRLRPELAHGVHNGPPFPAEPRARKNLPGAPTSR